jgi:hypothetical protein
MATAMRFMAEHSTCSGIVGRAGNVLPAFEVC